MQLLPYPALIATVLLAMNLTTSGLAFARQLDFRDIGIYGTSYDFLTLSVYKLLSSDDEARLKRYRDMIHNAHESGKFTLVGLYSFDRISYKQPVNVYIRKTDQLLDALNLNEVDALFLGEENVTWNNGLTVLNELFDHVKSRYAGPVYQWYTMPDVPHPKQRADGWIIDAYGFRHTEFRRYLMKYLVLGKPVISVINASTNLAPWESSQEQVRVCQEFNIPIFFFAVDPERGSPDIWLNSKDPDLAAWRGWVHRILEMAQQTPVSQIPQPSTQFSMGRPVEIAGNLQGQVNYEETFGSVRFMDDATIEGFLRLRWSGEEENLSVVSHNRESTSAILTYHFFSLLPLTDMTVTTDANAGVSVDLSTDGQIFHAGRSPGKDWEGQNLWVRLTLTKAPEGEIAGGTLRGWSLKGRVIQPMERAIQLRPIRNQLHYEDNFMATRYFQLAEIDRPDELIPARGGVSIRGRAGGTNRVMIRQHFISETPLEGLRVELISRAQEKNLNAHNELGVSLDGSEIIASDSTRGKANQRGRYDGKLTLNLSSNERLRGIREFWVHMVMVNASGVRTNLSNTLRNLQVWANLSKDK
jgi:hypothetical protein